MVAIRPAATFCIISRLLGLGEEGRDSRGQFAKADRIRHWGGLDQMGGIQVAQDAVWGVELGHYQRG